MLHTLTTMITFLVNIGLCYMFLNHQNNVINLRYSDIFRRLLLKTQNAESDYLRADSQRLIFSNHKAYARALTYTVHFSKMSVQITVTDHQNLPVKFCQTLLTLA